MKIRPVGAELFYADRWSDGQADVTKLIAAVQLTCLKDMGVMRITGFLTMPPELSKYDEQAIMQSVCDI